jgi:TolB protein
VSGKGTRYGVAWSPDRARLAFIYTSSGNLNESELHLINADGAQEISILGPGTFGNPAWSPDGVTLAFAKQFPDGTRRLMLLDATGQNLRELGVRSDWDWEAAWSPDGLRLAFVSNCLKPSCDSAVSDLWVMNADGSGAHRLTAGVGIDDDAYSPVWSPDGEWIAFDMERNSIRDVYRIRPDGTNLERLTSGTRFTSYLAPSYSPDGRQLVYTQWSGADGLTHLLITPADGGTATSLPLAVGEAIDPDWR